MLTLTLVELTSTFEIYLYLLQLSTASYHLDPILGLYNKTTFDFWEHKTHVMLNHTDKRIFISQAKKNIITCLLAPLKMKTFKFVF